jgi:sodium/bile acid cotransporter 7
MMNNRGGGGARISKKNPGPKIATLNPQPRFAPPKVVPSFEENGSALYATVVSNEAYGEFGVTKLRSVVDGLSSFIAKADAFVSRNFFLVGMMVAVSFAKLLPELGKNGSVLRPELFIGKYGVTTIFLLSGLSIKLKELTNAAVNMKLNGLIQMISFAAWPFLVGLPLTKGIGFIFPGLLPPALLDGLLILCCLPTTLNMCILLTSKAEGSGE